MANFDYRERFVTQKTFKYLSGFKKQVRMVGIFGQISNCYNVSIVLHALELPVAPSSIKLPVLHSEANLKVELKYIINNSIMVTRY